MSAPHQAVPVAIRPLSVLELEVVRRSLALYRPDAEDLEELHRRSEALETVESLIAWHRSGVSAEDREANAWSSASRAHRRALESIADSGRAGAAAGATIREVIVAPGVARVACERCGGNGAEPSTDGGDRCLGCGGSGHTR